MGNLTQQLWTESEVKLLREIYPNSSIPEISNRLNRTIASVSHKANRLGLRANRKCISQKLWRDPNYRTNILEKRKGIPNAGMFSSEGIKAKWQDPAYRGRMAKRKYKVPPTAGKFPNHDIWREGKRAWQDEEDAMAKVRDEFGFCERSQRVCDAIAIKDGQLYLIEFKLSNYKHYRKLKPLQAKTLAILGEKQYLVRDRHWFNLVDSTEKVST